MYAHTPRSTSMHTCLSNTRIHIYTYIYNKYIHTSTHLYTDAAVRGNCRRGLNYVLVYLYIRRYMHAYRRCMCICICIVDAAVRGNCRRSFDAGHGRPTSASATGWWKVLSHPDSLPSRCANEYAYWISGGLPSLHLSLSLFRPPVLSLSLAFFLSPCLPLSLSPPPSLSISSEAMPDLFGQRGAKASLQLHTLQSHSNALILPFDTPSPSLHPPLHPMLPSPRPFSQRCRNLRAIELPDLIESLKNHHALLMSTEATIKRARSSPSGITPSHRPPPFPQTWSPHG